MSYQPRRTTPENYSLLEKLVPEPLTTRRHSPTAPLQYRIVSLLIAGSGLFLLILVNLRQTVEECFCLRFQSEKAQTPQDSRDPQMIVIAGRKPDCRLGRKFGARVTVICSPERASSP
jgi:hypothetical protein